MMEQLTSQLQTIEMEFKDEKRRFQLERKQDIVDERITMEKEMEAEREAMAAEFERFREECYQQQTNLRSSLESEIEKRENHIQELQEEMKSFDRVVDKVKTQVRKEEREKREHLIKQMNKDCKKQKGVEKTSQTDLLQTVNMKVQAALGKSKSKTRS